MKILLDHCVPRQIRAHLPGHEAHTAYECGWAAFKNGALFSAPEAEGFTVVTTDQNLAHQQNLKRRTISAVILVAPTNHMVHLVPLIPAALTALDGIQQPQIVNITWSSGEPSR